MMATSVAVLSMVVAIATVAVGHVFDAPDLLLDGLTKSLLQAMVRQSSVAGAPVSLMQLTPSHLELQRLQDTLQHTKTYVTGLWSGSPASHVSWIPPCLLFAVLIDASFCVVESTSSGKRD
jgi:hypothetical protein